MKSHSRKLSVILLIPIILLALVSVPGHAPGNGTFKLVAAQSSATFTEGSIFNQTITITSLGFVGRVNVTAVAGRGVACILDPNFVTLVTTATSTLSCQGNTAATYTGILVQGAGLVPPSTIDMNQTDPITYTVNAQLYSATVNQGFVNAEAGTTSQTPTVTVTVTSLGSFTGTVNLTPSSKTMSCSMNVTSVTVSAGGSGHAGILCEGANPAFNPNQVTINATSSVNFGTPPKAVTVIHQTAIFYTLRGLVCLVDPGFITPTNACPATPQALLGMNSAIVGTQLRVAVALNDSAGIAVFDVTLLADHTKLQPVDADLTGGILPIGGTTVALKCIGGVLVVGPQCVSTDTADTIHLAAAASNFVSTSPTNGTLFTAVYNILQNITTPIPIMFQTGCGNSVVPTSIPPLCVTVSGGGTSVPEYGPQTVTYSTNKLTPLFGLKTKPTTLTFTQGSTPPAQTATIYLSEINGFSCGGLGCVDLSDVTPSPPPSGLQASLVFTTVSDPLVANSTISVSITRFTPAGIYPVKIIGRADTTNTPATGTTYLGSTTTITVIVVAASDFVIAANPSSIFGSFGTPVTTTVTVAGGSTFSGTVSLSTTINPATGLICGFNPGSVTIPPSTGTSQLSCTSSAGGNFTITVTGTSGMLTHSVTVTFGGIDFSVSANPSPLVVNPGQTGSTTIKLTSVNRYTGTVNLSATVSPAGATLSFSPTSVSVLIGGSATSSLSVTLPSGTSANSTVTVTATDGTITHMLNIIISPGLPSITIVSIATSASGNSTTVGQKVTVSVTVKNTGVTAGTFQLSVKFGTVTVATPQNVTLAGGATQTYTFMWDTTGYATGAQTLNAVVSNIPQGNVPTGQTVAGPSFTLQAASTSPLSDNLIWIITGIVVAVLVVATVLLLRRRGSSKTTTTT